MTTSGLLEQLERNRLASELILVDWNPPPGQVPLHETLAWPEHTEYCTVRAIEVPPTVHAKLPFADKLPFLIHSARNAGIRRARGRFVVSPPTDFLLSNELVGYLAAEQLLEDRMYRVLRCDVPEDVLGLSSVDARLAYCADNVVRRHERGSQILYTNASGDFTLVARALAQKVHGIPEATDLHSLKFDGVFCYMAQAAGAREEVLPDAMRIYRIDHESSWSAHPGLLRRTYLRARTLSGFIGRTAPWLVSAGRRLVRPSSRLGRLGIPVISPAGYEKLTMEIMRGERPFTYNDDAWGLRDEELPEQVVSAARWDRTHQAA